ncbi:MAG: hypothetical protein GXO78_11755 [Calditrichaeota bacterium]|nr:hypothetical protein [Calditrichota bacterium]
MKIIIRPVIFSVVMVGILLGIPAVAQQMEGEQSVIVKGVGVILAGDEAKAEDDAIANALRMAVEQVVGTLIQSDVLVQNYQVVESNIYSQSRGYVKTYRVLNRARRGENILEVTIEAVVKKSDLESDLQALGLLMTRKGMPRLMVLVDERNMDEHHATFQIDMNTTETELMNELMNKGFTFVDRNVVMRKIKRDAIMAAIEGDVNSAKSIALESGAELLIIGKAVSKPAANVPSVVRQAGLVSVQATINLRAIRADDGRIIATTSQQAAAAHIDPLNGGTRALQKAARLAAEDLTRKIVQVWQKDVYSGTTIQIRILDIPSYADLVKFRNMMKSYVRGVKNIYQREFTGTVALLDVEVTGKASQIAEELALKDFSPYRVEILNVSQNSLVIKLKREP